LIDIKELDVKCNIQENEMKQTIYFKKGEDATLDGLYNLLRILPTKVVENQPEECYGTPTREVFAKDCKVIVEELKEI